MSYCLLKENYFVLKHRSTRIGANIAECNRSLMFERTSSIDDHVLVILLQFLLLYFPVVNKMRDVLGSTEETGCFRF